MNAELLGMLAVIASAVVLALGGVITHLAYRAYRRTSSPIMRTFAAGFGLVTLGLLFGGVHQLLALDLVAGLVVQRTLTVAGFGLLVYSLYETVDDGERSAS